MYGYILCRQLHKVAYQTITLHYITFIDKYNIYI